MTKININNENGNNENDYINNQFDNYLTAIDNKNIDEFKILITQDIIENRLLNKKYQKDILYETYDKKLLTIKRLKFVVYRCSKYITISSSLIKRLIKENNIQLLNIIFKTHRKLKKNKK
ncbi:hypothetical protein H8356DRAFT_1089205 [Neocallimastix lanati (nom. inval.)]|nr:hypothetical protein H8356DRAFT_1089205 [Neocallimastix sp. JGI-2020a]